MKKNNFERILNLVGMMWGDGAMGVERGVCWGGS